MPVEALHALPPPDEAAKEDPPPTETVVKEDPPPPEKVVAQDPPPAKKHHGEAVLGNPAQQAVIKPEAAAEGAQEGEAGHHHDIPENDHHEAPGKEADGAVGGVGQQAAKVEEHQDIPENDHHTAPVETDGQGRVTGGPGVGFAGEGRCDRAA